MSAKHGCLFGVLVGKALLGPERERVIYNEAIYNRNEETNNGGECTELQREDV